MKKKIEGLIIIALLGFSLPAIPQELPGVTELLLEEKAQVIEAEQEDDLHLQDLDHFRKYPVDLNATDGTDLLELKILSVLQVQSFLLYRKLLGSFLHIYELQAVPGWDPAIIRNIIPFVRLGNATTLKEDLAKMIRAGEHSLIIRMSSVLEQAEGYQITTGYKGSRQQVFSRYRYQYKNLFQYGVTAEKDAGEQFFGGKQKLGFDFYSFHLFLKNHGRVRAFALGDFSINLGQGLVHWQTAGAGKSSNVIGVKRQSPTLRAYSSSGEFNFHRGSGITLGFGKFEATAFISLRRLSANVRTGTLSNLFYISSFNRSGYHRTVEEQKDKGQLSQLATGGNLVYKFEHGHVGLNMVRHSFSLPILASPEPYNQFAIGGSNWTNAGFDYSFTFRNMHVFGEFATDKKRSLAAISGVILSADRHIDLAFLHRGISRDYKTVSGHAVTENTEPSNENGLYAGIHIRASSGWQMQAYTDVFSFSWLKYRVDAPSAGKECFIQLHYQPKKNSEIYFRFVSATKVQNEVSDERETRHPMPFTRNSWRFHFHHQLKRDLAIRSRVEMVTIKSIPDIQLSSSKGYLGYLDLIFKPLMKRLAGSCRLQYFETDGYEARLYAYENDVLYYAGVPAYFDRGWRYYINMSFDVTEWCGVWLKWGQTRYPGKTETGTGLDRIGMGRKSEFRCLVRLKPAR